MRLARLLVCALALAPAALPQGAAARLDVTAPRPAIIAGEQMQLSVIARNNNGDVVATPALTWTTSDGGVLTVNAQGLVTARRPGLAFITAQSGNLRSPADVQVLPQRVDLSPPNREILVGETVQFTATPYNINGEPIADVTFTWEVRGANGGQINAASISRTGLFQGSGVCRATVIAYIGYPDRGGGRSLTQYVSYATVDVLPRADFRLRRLLSNDDVRHSAILGYAQGPIAVNDSGQVAFLGTLDGLTQGLLLLDGGRWNLLSSTGTPGPQTAVQLTSFTTPSINTRGQVLTNAFASGGGGGIIVTSRGETDYVLLNGASVGFGENVGNQATSRDSLNDFGDVLFRANFNRPGTPDRPAGLIRISSGRPDLVAASDQTLPGLGANLSFDYFGIDNEATAWFIARSGTNSVLYRTPSFQTPVRVIGSGDRLADSTVASVGDLVVARTGEVAFSVNLNSGSHIARYRQGRVETLRDTGRARTLDVNATGAVLFHGNGSGGEGIYRWRGDEVTPLLQVNRLAPNDEPVRSIEFARMTSSGDVIAQIRTADNDFVVVRLGSGAPSLLTQLGQRIDVDAGLHLAAIARGSGSRAVYLLLGNPASLFELDPSGALIPRVILGDRLPGGGVITFVGNVMTRANGDAYFTSNGGIFRIAAEKLELVLPTGVTAGEIRLNSLALLAVNDDGSIVVESNTSNGFRLYLWAAGRFTELALRDAAAPGGGVITSWGQIALDSRGRVVANFGVRNGPAGLYYHDGARWQALAIFETGLIAGRPFQQLLSVKAIEDRFYIAARVVQSGTVGAVVEFRDGTWRTLVSGGDALANGATLGNFGNADVNRTGQVVYSPNGIGLLLRDRETDRIVQLVIDPVWDTGEYLRLNDFVLRDDGRVYLTAFNQTDRLSLYVAEPVQP